MQGRVAFCEVQFCWLGCLPSPLSPSKHAVFLGTHRVERKLFVHSACLCKVVSVRERVGAQPGISRSLTEKGNFAVKFPALQSALQVGKTGEACTCWRKPSRPRNPRFCPLCTQSFVFRSFVGRLCGNESFRGFFSGLFSSPPFCTRRPTLRRSWHFCFPVVAGRSLLRLWLL